MYVTNPSVTFSLKTLLERFYEAHQPLVTIGSFLEHFCDNLVNSWCLYKVQRLYSFSDFFFAV